MRRRGTISQSGRSNSNSAQSSRTSTGSLDGSRRASACSRVILPAPVMPVTRTLPRWLMSSDNYSCRRVASNEDVTRLPHRNVTACVPGAWRNRSQEGVAVRAPASR